MKDRIKQIRKESGLSQTRFGETVGVSLSAEQKWELGISTPSAAVITLICQKYGVSETWLRTGAGQMKADTTREEEMGQLLGELLADRSESFRSALITTLLRFPPDGPEWEVLERIYENLAAELEDETK